MFSTLLDIAWGAHSNALNQIFSMLLLAILVVQAIRFLIFWDRINQWSRAFVEAKIAFDNEHAVKLKSKMDELQPPHSASAQLWILLPPVIIMMGLIGTFVGLTLALAVIPFGGSAQEIQAGVQKALPSMGSAFWTSLSAICGALVIRLTTMMMEAMFKRRVLRSIVSADPQLIQYIERQAFKENKPGALLRPHSLREVLWQQNIEFTRQLERLGSEISSAIRELPYALPGGAGVSTPTSFVDAEVEQQVEENSQHEINSPDDQSSSSDHQQEQEKTEQSTISTVVNTVPEHEMFMALLHESRKQTQLLEQLVGVTLRSTSAQRLGSATVQMSSKSFSDESSERKE